MRFKAILVLSIFAPLLLTQSAPAAPENATADFTVDAAQSLGPFKPINGVNGGPRVRLANYYNNARFFARIDPPVIRLHDVRYSDEETVDIHCIFPIFSADENDPANYRFAMTDRQIESIVDMGYEIIFRLGESIEWAPDKYYVHPPEDFKKWARICVNIVRHYNMGWANGHEWNIKRWEIWNEPDVYPCWTGSMEQYNEMYEVTAKALKELDPDLVVGGPALAGPLRIKRGRQFLSFCRERQLPLDFVSFHGYAPHPRILIEKIESNIEVLKEYGYGEVETQFTEWNYAAPRSRNRDTRFATREAFARVHGGPGAAFAATTLAQMQETELDLACFYAAFGSIFRYGFFDIYGAPKAQFYTFEAFNQLVQCGERIAVAGNDRDTGLGISAAANVAGGTTAVLLSNFEDERSSFELKIQNLPLRDELHCSEFVIDDERRLEFQRDQVFTSGDIAMPVDLPRGTVRLLLFTREPVSGL